MSTIRFERLTGALKSLLVIVALVGPCGCSDRVEQPAPLLVISGPDSFTSLMIQDATGAAIWRLEADGPTPVPALYYGTVPAGFRQTLPATGKPRAFEPGEEVLMESRIPNRVFVHTGYADTEASVVILGWAMRRIETAPIPIP